MGKPPWEPAPKDTRFGWLRSKFYDGTPDNPIRREGKESAMTPQIREPLVRLL
jgi:hypothetical protein